MTMHTPDKEDREFEELLKGTPMGSDAPDDLKRRLRSYAGYSRVRRPRKWVPRLVIVGASAAGLTAAAMLMWPTSASAKSFEKVLNATNQAKSFRITVDEDDRGAVKHVSLMDMNGVLDIHAEDGTHAQIDKGKVSVYDPREKTLTVVRFAGSAQLDALGDVLQKGLAEGFRQFDVKKMLAEFKARYGEENGKVSDTFVEDGREVYTLDLQSPRDSSWAKITVDADSDLPVRIQARERRDKAVDMRLDYGVDVQIEPLEKTVPKDVKRIDFDVQQMLNQAAAFGQGMRELGSALGKAVK